MLSLMLKKTKIVMLIQKPANFMTRKTKRWINVQVSFVNYNFMEERFPNIFVGKKK